MSTCSVTTRHVQFPLDQWHLEEVIEENNVYILWGYSEDSQRPGIQNNVRWSGYRSYFSLLIRPKTKLFIVIIKLFFCAIWIQRNDVVNKSPWKYTIHLRNNCKLCTYSYRYLPNFRKLWSKYLVNTYLISIRALSSDCDDWLTHLFSILISFINFYLSIVYI